ncbi:hypothetical protein BOO34_18430 [Vibrio navarrensis]|nr:hypothetical protein [Vibrio navarrensis]
MSNYERLIFLANENNTRSTAEKISELNQLLFNQKVDEIKDDDLQIIDDLISILSNTGNLFPEKHKSIINLQENIRSRIYQ